MAEVDPPEGGAKVKSCPVPIRLTVCGLPAALSVIVMVPVRFPPAVGLNVTAMAQFAPAATLDPQVLVSAKSPALAPEIAMLVTLSAAFPLFESVTICGAVVISNNSEVKVRLTGDRPTMGPVPVPLRTTFCVLPATPLLLSVTVNVPVRLPSAVGLNVTLIVQLAPAATLVPQVSVAEKSPPAAMLVTLNTALPVLLSVTGWAALLVPTV